MLGITPSQSSPRSGPSTSLGICSSIEDSDEDGTEVFRRQAQQCSPGYTIPRTRSHTKADMSEADQAEMPEKTTQEKSLFSIGDLVFAHKGKIIPCWFPGLVLEKCKKGFKIEFYAGLGKEDCVTGNMMLYSDYDQKKKNGAKSKLFQIPKKMEEDFHVGMELASVQCSSKKN